MQDVYVDAVPIELMKLLKFAGLVHSGGEAKVVIDAGLVLVNGAREMRKRAKLTAGDTVTFNETTVRVVAQ